MGALTLKPSAYQARPWELTKVNVFNHYEGTGMLTLHLRGFRIMRVSQPGWMKDRIRFLYDGYRRQRLTVPYLEGCSVGWSTGLTYWATLLAGRNFIFKVDPEVVHLYWLLRGYNFFRDSRGPLRVVSLDVNVRGHLYHGAFGLKATFFASLILPACLTHEEEQVLTSPTGAVSFFLTGTILPQLFSLPTGAYRYHRFLTPGVNYPRQEQRALFQVSPLQGLLGVS